MDEKELQAIKERREAAHAKVVDMCSGSGRWQMSIPADRARDHDLVIGASLRDIPALVAALEEARQLLYDTAMDGHRRHNQHFERCEADVCIKVRAALGISGYGHRFDAGYHEALADLEREAEADIPASPR